MLQDIYLPSDRLTPYLKKRFEGKTLHILQPAAFPKDGSTLRQLVRQELW